MHNSTTSYPTILSPNLHPWVLLKVKAPFLARVLKPNIYEDLVINSFDLTGLSYTTRELQVPTKVIHGSSL